MACFSRSDSSYSLAIVDHHQVASARMVARIYLVVLLLCSIVSVTPLAFAYPPDPSWIPGMYDEDDQDDVVTLATSAFHAVVRPPIDASQPPVALMGRVSLAEEAVLVDRDRCSVQSRAPPTL